MIDVTPTITLDEDELVERFVRASGPGGQHVNKTSVAVELRFDARRSPSLPDDVSVRLQQLAGSRLTSDGVIVIHADSRRSQQMNREEARERLLAMIRQAAAIPKRRRPTRPTLASKTRRLEGKTRRAGIKAGRGKPATHD